MITTSLHHKPTANQKSVAVHSFSPGISEEGNTIWAVSQAETKLHGVGGF